MTNPLKYSELRSLDSAIEQLQELVDGLRKGVLRLVSGEHQLLLTPGAVLDFSLYAQRKGVQERLELALEWRRQELTIGSGLQGIGTASKLELMPAPPAQALALQAERLEDELEPPVSSDDDDTVADDTVADDTVADDTAADDVDEAHSRKPSVRATPSVTAVQLQDEIDDEAVTVRHSSPPGGQPRASVRGLDSDDPERLERVYREARTPASDGRLRLDEQRFVDLLAAAGLDPQLQQELRTLAREADEAGRDRLFNERSISDMIESSLSGVA